MLPVLRCSNIHPSLVVLGPTTTLWFPMPTLNNVLFDTSSIREEPPVNKIPRTVSTLLSFSSEEGPRRLLRGRDAGHREWLSQQPLPGSTARGLSHAAPTLPALLQAFLEKLRQGNLVVPGDSSPGEAEESPLGAYLALLPRAGLYSQNPQHLPSKPGWAGRWLFSAGLSGHTWGPQIPP